LGLKKLRCFNEKHYLHRIGFRVCHRGIALCARDDERLQPNRARICREWATIVDAIFRDIFVKAYDHAHAAVVAFTFREGVVPVSQDPTSDLTTPTI
jgi:hypothetical protein